MGRVLDEILDALCDKVIPHGAAELGQALCGSGSAYTPYGVVNRELEPMVDEGIEPASAYDPSQYAAPAAPAQERDDGMVME